MTRTPSMWQAVARQLQRTIKFAEDGYTPIWMGDPPSEAEVTAAVEEVKGIKIISRLQFMALFAASEIHEIQRRAAQSASTSATAPAVANVWAAFVAADNVKSDSAVLKQGLQVLVTAGLLTQARADKVAKFQPLN